ncbi:MAG: 50S ribosomal protein L35 [Candidatus Gracilibacteria bacterium]|jgi:large subunit ribosomal protein L35|nr:MAG: hypothetical protein US89_C0006G0046 [Candidatus Peregrinibacteria bacterium GW2011_GWF2_38_29]HBB03237.1 50S ribosomal protein L35 [Candidatus Peregrinibacteria bacterium]
MKQRTHSGAKKRMRMTAKKKVVFKKPCRNHLLFGKSKRQKRTYRKGLVGMPSDMKAVRALLPNNQ